MGLVASTSQHPDSHYALPVGPGPKSYVFQTQPLPGACHYRKAANGDTLPDPNCTPGATNPDVTQDTLKDTICKSGYTWHIRPPMGITNREKWANAKSYSYDGPWDNTEYDHLIPLQLGGDPNDPRNLWVEPAKAPNHKDAVELKLKTWVCSGKVTLQQAQEAIATDWTTALDSLR